MDEVDSSASEEGAGMISVFMATGARLIGMNLVGTVIRIGALILQTFAFFFFFKKLSNNIAKQNFLSFVIAITDVSTSSQ